MKRIIVWLAVMMYTLSGYAQNAPWNFQSKVVTDTLFSKVLNSKRAYTVFLPKSFEQNKEKKYPVLYLLHGMWETNPVWTERGHVKDVMDRLVASGEACEMIIVTPNAGGNIHLEWNGYFDMPGWKYETFFYTEFLPYIEKKYRVIGDRLHRAIAGLSMGGGGALFYALHYPEMFVAAAPLSAVGGAWTFDQMKSQSDLSKVSEEKKAEVLGQMDIQTILEKSPKEKLDRIKWIRWYISCGDDDFLSVTNCLLHNTLLQHQVGHEFRMKDGSHSWTYWRMELPEVMRFVSRIFTQY